MVRRGAKRGPPAEEPVRRCEARRDTRTSAVDALPGPAIMESELSSAAAAVSRALIAFGAPATALMAVAATEPGAQPPASAAQGVVVELERA